MSDSRERFEAWARDNLPSGAPAIKGFARMAYDEGKADMQSELNAERIKRECAERRLFAAIRRCAEIAQDKNPWPSHHAADAIRAEFPEAFNET
jgi:hypothetical protein